jgi:hypothetical protein
MSLVHERIAKLKEMYAHDEAALAQLAQDEEHIRTLLQTQEFATLEVTKTLMALCRADILRARKRLATDKSLVGNESAQRALWAEIEGRQWFLSMVVKDYAGEIAAIEQQLEADLQP